MSDQEKHNYCTNKFIDLANELKNEGFDNKLISAALMASSGIYATYVAAGNTGYLEPSGVNKVAEIYRANLEHIQHRKREELQKAETPASEN